MHPMFISHDISLTFLFFTIPLEIRHLMTKIVFVGLLTLRDRVATHLHGKQKNGCLKYLTNLVSRHELSV